MRCTMGEKEAALTVLPLRTVFLCGKPMANVSDHISMVNLAPFGRCRSLGYPATAAATAAHHGHLTPMPCSHNTPIPWTPGKTDYYVKGHLALLKSCKLQCMWGGTISLITDGQVGEGTQWIKKESKTIFHNDTNSEIAMASGAPLVYDTSRDKTNLITGREKLLFNNSSSNSLRDKRKEQLNRMAQAFLSEANRSDENCNGKNSNLGLHDENISDFDKYKFGVNCGTTTSAFLLRKLGFQVTARGRGGENDSTTRLAEDPFSMWSQNTQKDVTFLKEKFLKAKTEFIEERRSKLKSKEEAEMDFRKGCKVDVYFGVLKEVCKEEGYYILNLTWNDKSKIPVTDENGNRVTDKNGNIVYKKDKKGNPIWSHTRHATIIKSEKNAKGEIVLKNIEPQTGEPLPMDDLLRSMAMPEDMVEPSVLLGNGRSAAGDGVMRVLTLENPPVLIRETAHPEYLDAFDVINK